MLIEVNKKANNIDGTIRRLKKSPPVISFITTTSLSALRKSRYTNYHFKVVTMSSIDVAKQIHKDVDRMLKGLSIEDQEIVLKEAHNIVESLKRIEQITSKVKAQA
jgi:hypothetical protein